MKLLAHLLYPGEHNNYHPHLTRAPFLVGVFFFLISLSVLTNTFFSTRPKILGFATNIYTGEVIKDTNTERQKEGLSTLTENTVLDEIAQAKGKDMFAKNYWAHSAPDGTMPWHFFEQANYKYLYAGENLARDFYTSQAVVTAWMNSSSHRENVLGKNYKEIGVAVLNGQFDGLDTTLIVQMFGTPLDAYTPVPSQDTPTQGVYITPASVSTSSILPVSTLGTTQKIYLGVSVMLMSFFLFDSYVLIKNRIRHRNRHPFFHALVLGGIIFLIIYLNKGIIL